MTTQPSTPGRNGRPSRPDLNGAAHTADGDGQLRPVNPSGNRYTPPTGAVTLAHWFLEAQHDERGDKLWRVLNAKGFAALFYGAREGGEIVRGWALQRLYINRPTPGGQHPDPRIPAAFSQQAVLKASAGLLGLRIWMPPADLVREAEAAANQSPTRRRPILAWLQTYPEGRSPELAVRDTPRQQALHVAMAMLMGYLIRERDRILEPGAPAGIIHLPTDPSLTSILHQFAIALLCLEPECPADAVCLCNQIRARYNAPPPDHEQATDALQVAQLRAAADYPQSGPHSNGPRRSPPTSGPTPGSLT